MKITKINGVPVPPSELFVPPTVPQFAVQWNQVRPGGLGVLKIKIRVDGAEVNCPVAQCGPFGVPLQAGNVNIDPDNYSGCMHTVQVEGFTDPDPGEGERDNSPTEVFWLSAYKDCTGPEECDATEIGGPVDVATGTMHYEVRDLAIPGPLGIEVRRRYRSDRSDLDAGLGHGWRHPYIMKLEDVDVGRKVFIDERGRRVYFGATQSNGGVPIWNPNAIERLELVEETSPAGWTVTDLTRKVYRFDTSGRLTAIEDRNGNSVSLGYTGSKLTAITDAFGRGLSLAYDGNDRLWTLTAGSRSVTFTYDSGTSNLERVDWSDGSFETYEYEDPNDDHNLTAVRDSYGRLIESHTYDASDRVTATQSDSGNSAYTLVYDSATQTTVTNSLGVPSVFNHDSFSGMVTTSSGPGCAACGGGGTGMTIVRDRFLRPVTITDAEGVVTKLSYDSVGNVLTRTEAFGVPGVARTTTYTWHPTFNLPLTVSVPSVGSCGSPDKIVTNTYDPATGNRLTEQVTGCAAGVPFSRTTTWTYDTHGHVETIDGPRTDVSDVTTYDYYSDGDSDVNRRGRLHRVTNALGHETDYAGYDLFGNVGSVTTASNIVGNSVETTYLYDEKDRVTETRIKGSVPADDIVTEQVYDLEGNLDFVRLPNCVEAGPGCAFSVDYVYDTVNRLEEVHDPFGNKIVYTYDTAGNRTREEYRDGLDVVQRFTNFKYDSYNRLQYTYFTDVVPENPGSVFFKYGYFDDGQRQSERDPERHITNFAYDELKRLKTVTQTVGVDTLTTEYGYDVQDNLATVEDPNGLVTTYTNHDMGWRLGVDSPDTGVSTYNYDPAGNLTSTTDANGVTSSRTYDALDRLTSITYPDTSFNVSQSYDSAAVTFGIGRRTGMTDASGSTVYGYDRRGLPVREEKTIGAATYVTQYAYDKTGNLKQILYPTDNPGLRQGQADYTYDSADRVTAITAKVNGSTTPVASSVAYKPFGPRTSLAFGNGLVDSRTYGTRYQLGGWTLGSLLSYSHAFDNDLNLTSRTDNLNAANNRVFGYDEIHRLTDAAGPWGPGTSCPGGATYTYDLNGNRLCKGEVTPPTNYTYVSGTNRLGSTTGGEPATFNYDANGNTTGDGTHTYDYSDADRLASVDTGSTATYTYDGEGRRVSKSVGVSTTYFFYDPVGRLLSEIVPASAIGKDYLFLHDAPVGRVDWTTEQDLGNVLRLGKSSPNVHLDWTLYPSGSNTYVVRRKQVVDPSEKTFDGAAAIATVTDPTRTYDDPLLNDGNCYDYRVFRRAVSESLFFYHADHLGTPIAMTDGAASFAWRAEHRPFGGLDGLSVSTVASNLRFSGQFADGETDVYQNWHREYVPATGRYTQADPLGLDQSANLYSYVDARPTVTVDPSGLVSSAADCDKCCAPVQKLKELDSSEQWLDRYHDRYRFGIVRVCRGESCGTSADRLRSDLERMVRPRCWISSLQLTTGTPGRLFNRLVGRPLDLGGAIAYGSVHYVVTYKPCDGKGPSYFFDGYWSTPRYGPTLDLHEIEE